MYAEKDPVSFLLKVIKFITRGITNIKKLLMKRKSFLTSTAWATAGLIITKDLFGHSKGEIYGHNEMTYTINKNWGSLNPDKTPVNDCHEMIQDVKGRIILLTSGTSGYSKGIIINEEMILMNIKNSQTIHNFCRKDVINCHLSFAHSGGLFIQTIPALFYGAKLLIHKKESCAMKGRCAN